MDGKLVVTRTRDGGKSSVDETVDLLAIGSTTGGVWVSDDQGDHWAPLPARLPPVHAVRFA